MNDANATLRSVLVTGSSTGIGEACALDLDKLGFRVFASVRKEEDAERIKSQASERFTTVIMDVTDADTVRQAADTIEASVGEAGLFGLVNNAGIAIPGPLECVPLDQVRRQFEVNVIGQLGVTQAVLPLIRTAQGRVVNMGSISGLVAPPYMGPYSASKFAFHSMNDALRIELKRWDIHVSIIAPDIVATPIWGKIMDTAFEMGKHLPRPIRKLYKEDLTAMWQTSQKADETGMGVDRVVRAVRHALTARRPKTRYFVGRRTVAAFWGARNLPNRISDWFVRRQMGMK